MTGTDIVLLVAGVAIAYLYLKVSVLKDTIHTAYTELVLLRDTPKAEKLIAEYKELGGEKVTRVSNGDDRHGRPQLLIKVGSAWGVYETLESFDCNYVCPLRKQRLEQLKQKKPRKKK